MRLNTIAIAIASLLSVSVNANAADTFGAPTIDPAFRSKLATVCEDKAIVMTADARRACDTGAFPALVSTGASFANRGIGAEFNAYIRQIVAVIATK